MRKFISLIGFWVCIFQLGCGSGGGGSSNSNSSSGASSPASNGQYFVSLSADSISLELPYESKVSLKGGNIKVMFKGDGLVVGYPPGEQADSNLHVTATNVSTGEAILNIEYAPYIHLASSGVVTRTLRIITGSVDKGVYAYKDLIVKLYLASGVYIDETPGIAYPVDSKGRVEFSTNYIRWELSSDSPWIIPSQKAGGSGSFIGVDIGYDFSKALPGTNQGKIHLVASDGSGSAEKTVAVQLENTIYIQDGDLSNISDIEAGIKYPVNLEWGQLFGFSRNSVITHLKGWKLTSDNAAVSFSPASGDGMTEFSALVDTKKLSVGTHAIKITVEGQGMSNTKNYHINVVSPKIPPSKDAVFATRDINGSISDAVVDFKLVSGGVASWSVKSMPEWLTSNVSTGNTNQPLSLSINSNTGGSTKLVGEVILNYTVPGAQPVDVKIPVIGAVAPFVLNPERHSFSYVDYGQGLNKKGEFSFLGLEKIKDLDVNSNLIASSSADWLVVDSAKFKGVGFHLQTEKLSNGFHWAAMTVSHPSNLIVKPATVYVGYYKSSTAPVPFKNTNPYVYYRSVQSPLGPWTYVNNNAGVDVFNNFTGVVEKTIGFPEGMKIDSIAISDDGQFLMGVNESSATGYVYSVLSDSFSEKRTINSSYSQSGKFTRISGIQFLEEIFGFRIYDGWTMADGTLNGWDFSGTDGVRSRYRDGWLGWSRYYNRCELGYQEVTFNFLRNWVEFADPKFISIGECPGITTGVAFSDGSKYFLRASSATGDMIKNEIALYSVGQAGNVLKLSSLVLNDGSEFVQAGVTRKGEVILLLRESDAKYSIRVYGADLKTYKSVKESAFETISGFKLSGDEGFVIYTYEDSDTRNLVVKAKPLDLF